MAGIRIAPAALRDFVVAIFTAAGMPPAAAAATAEVLVWADTRGVASHGISRVPRYLELIAIGEMVAAAAPDILQPAPALLRIDGKRGPGPVAMRAAAERAIAVAREMGSAVAVVGTTTHTGAIGVYASQIAQAGMAGIVLAAGIPNMAYHGARVPGLSTSPIAIGVPGPDDGPPLLLDMATAGIAMGRLWQMQAADADLPPDLALTQNGAPATRAREAALLLPLGGAKGSGLSLLFECLTSLMAGAPVLAGFLDGSDRRHLQNALLIVVNIAALRPLAEFRADLTYLRDLIRALPRRPGFDELLLPGERGDRAAARAAQAITLAAKPWQALCDAAAKANIPLPAISA